MRKKFLIFFILIAIIAAAMRIIWANTALTSTYIAYKSEAVPKEFDGFRIVQLSDTHDAEIGDDNSGLIAAIAAARPNIIVITGDLIDSHRTDIPRAIFLAARAAEIAPTYYVNGNHEALIGGDYEILAEGLKNAGVIVLEDTSVTISQGESSFRLIGLTDIGFLSGSVDEKIAAMEYTLTGLTGEGLDIVLSHRPELVESYAAAGAELVFCGHAHGGQFRLPFIGGIIAPGQGLFPEYDAGLYEIGGTSMIVSRGIGNSIVPIRFNNRPEIVVVELIHE
ncbi:MAG: metallophosphoesterase [Clostridia bacterium]|nr:metallophosphoesterase [Clostridia bacterium]